MPFSDEQFQKLWELVIRIDENTKNHGRELSLHTADDLAKFALTKSSIDAVHTRLDKVKEELVVERSVIKSDLDANREANNKAIGFQNKLLGAILLAAFLVPILIQIWMGKGN